MARTTPLTIGGKVAPSAIMRAKSAPQRQAIITRNSDLFTLGNTIPAQRLRTWYGIPPLDIDGLSPADTVTMIRNHDLCMVNAYVNFNKVLARRGLVIRRQKGTYKIQTLPRASVRVSQLGHESTLKARASRRLNTGIVRYQGVFSPLSAEELLASE